MRATVSWSAQAHRIGRIRGPMGLFSKVLVANRGEIADPDLPDAARARRSARSPCTRRRTAGRCTCARRRRGVLLGPGAGESYLDQERMRRGRAARRRRGDPSRLRLPGRERRVRAGGRGGRPRLDRPAAGGDRGDGLEDRGARADEGRGRADHPRGRPSRSTTAAEVRRARRRARLAARDQGVGRRRRQGLHASSAEDDDVERAFETAQREGEAYFSDPTVYVERYLEDPRHVEVQVLADAHGNVIHLGERDCTIQRRHQKLVEETPVAGRRRGAPRADRRDRRRRGARGRLPLGRDDRGPARSRDGAYYFMEMNTRIQVEHTVTELVTGLDLVREQVLIAAGEPLSLRQEDVRLTRARDRVPDQRRGRRRSGFRPTPGRIAGYREPGGPGRARRLRRRGRLARSRRSTTR